MELNGGCVWNRAVRFIGSIRVREIRVNEIRVRDFRVKANQG